MTQDSHSFLFFLVWFGLNCLERAELSSFNLQVVKFNSNYFASFSPFAALTLAFNLTDLRKQVHHFAKLCPSACQSHLVLVFWCHFDWLAEDLFKHLFLSLWFIELRYLFVLFSLVRTCLNQIVVEIQSSSPKLVSSVTIHPTAHLLIVFEKIDSI